MSVGLREIRMTNFWTMGNAARTARRVATCIAGVILAIGLSGCVVEVCCKFDDTCADRCDRTGAAAVADSKLTDEDE